MAMSNAVPTILFRHLGLGGAVKYVRTSRVLGSVTPKLYFHGSSHLDQAKCPVEAAKEGVNKAKNAGEDVKDKAQDGKEKMKDKAEDMTNKAKGKAEDAWKSVKDATDKVKKKVGGK